MTTTPVAVTIGHRPTSGRTPALSSTIIRAARAATAADISAPSALSMALTAGYHDGRTGRPDTISAETIAAVRGSQAFKPVPADILTPPAANLKLAKGSLPSYGMTLAHADISGYESCVHRGDCTAVCVLNNGHGRYASTQRAWIWRTLLWAHHPITAAYRTGYELGRAVSLDGPILFRPNVNSDLRWDTIVPAIGHLDQVTVYGYTKDPRVLGHTGPIIGGIWHAYSYNETSNIDQVRAHLELGGAVAVVASHRPHHRPHHYRIRAALGVSSAVTVTDADSTDEWMLRARPGRGIIGALSAKGKARSLIGRSGFILNTGQ
jgi:hypothetical protein